MKRGLYDRRQKTTMKIRAWAKSRLKTHLQIVFPSVEFLELSTGNFGDIVFSFKIKSCLWNLQMVSHVFRKSIDNNDCLHLSILLVFRTFQKWTRKTQNYKISEFESFHFFVVSQLFLAVGLNELRVQAQQFLSCNATSCGPS